MIIAIDFDGTCVTHEFPEVGKDIGAAEVIKLLKDNGHDIILWTMRSGGRDDGDKVLMDAVNWFSDNNILLYGVNKNPDQVSWTQSPKVYAHKYIDDAAAGCPLIFDKEYSGRPYVDWVKMKQILIDTGFISDGL